MHIQLRQSRFLLRNIKI